MQNNPATYGTITVKKMLADTSGTSYFTSLPFSFALNTPAFALVVPIIQNGMTLKYSTLCPAPSTFIAYNISST